MNRREEIDPIQCDVNPILGFLTKISHQGLENIYARSAIFFFYQKFYTHTKDK